MNLCSKAAAWTFAACLSILCLGGVSASAQTVTTGSLTGVLRDAQGGVLPGATVTATHTPTGTTYDAVTDAVGRYSILNVRPGPYTVVANMSGFKSEKQENVDVALGAERTVDFKLQLASVTESIEVTAESPTIDLSRAGTADNISNAVKENLPTITRSITDIARISPLFNAQGSGAGDGASVLSVAGSSYRYNSLQIDGAANNDLFGLASSAGAPGGTAETQPVSLDAIAEIQLVVSPYDVRQGGFAGGGVNAITKSGSNDIHGTGFFFGRNQDWVGKGITDTKISTFKDKQGGFSVGGPLMKNKAFYFGTADYGRKVRPTGFSVHSTGQQFLQPDLFDRYINDLKTLYGYTPGSDPGGEFSRATDSDKYFVRGDFNVAKGHQLTIRHNYINALNDIGSPSRTSFVTPDAFYRYVSKTNSTVAQLNSQFGSGVNELRFTYTRVRDHRENPIGASPFPQVTVTLAAGVTVKSGTEQFSARNAIDQDIIELNDAYTMLKGTHTLTVGTHNEFLNLKNLFIRDNFGTYNFASLDNLEAGLAQQYDHSYSATSDPLQRAAFKVAQWGFYAGDQWRVKPKLTLTYGVRMDAPTFPDKPRANPVAVQNFGYATDVVPNQIEWSPRIGFNYDLSGNGTQQVRGGVGTFTGRPAYVWISNQFGNTGIDFTRIGASFNTNNKIPFVTDPLNQPTTVTGASAGSFSNEIDVVDPNFKYPSILRGNIGYDHTLLWGFVGTADFVWSKTLNDIKYQNLNFVQVPGATGVGGRPFFTKNVAAFSDVILLENTNKGYSYNFAYEVRRPFRNGVFVQGSYLVRRRQDDHGRHLGSGSLQLGERLRAGQPERRAARHLELRSGSPHHLRGDLRDSAREGHPAGHFVVLLGPDRPALHAGVQPRRQRRQPRLERPGLHPDRERRDHLHRRDVSGPHQLGQRGQLSGRLRGSDHPPQRVPRAVDQYARRPLRDPASVQAVQDRNHPGRVQPDQPVQQRPRDHSVPVLQRHPPAGPRADLGDADEPADRLQHRHARLADVQPVQPRRPALALAGPARRARPLLARLRLRRWRLRHAG